MAVKETLNNLVGETVKDTVGNSSLRQKCFERFSLQLGSISPSGRIRSCQGFRCLESYLQRFFYRYGRLVARHPVLFVALPLIATTWLAVGLWYGKEANDTVEVMTPSDAPSRHEQRVINAKWPLRHHNYVPGRSMDEYRQVQVIAIARNGANVLLPPYARAVSTLNKFIMYRIRVRHQNSTYFYEDLCVKWDDACDSNPQLVAVSKAYNDGHNISFPSIRVRTNKYHLASSLGGVDTVDGESGEQFVQSARAWMLLYRLKQTPAGYNYVSMLWEEELTRRLLNDYFDPSIQLTFLTSLSLNEELNRNEDLVRPKIIITFTILIFFSMTCNFCLLDDSKIFIDWTLSKPLLALCGVLTAGMGVVSAVGFLNFCGMTYHKFVVIMPFLAVSIGVDNMFLMTAALRRTDRSSTVEERIGHGLADVAVSITITALTDALSFGIGAITTIWAMNIFCVYTCAAIVFTFLYQLTVFLAVMVLQAQLEACGRHSVLWVKTKALLDTEKQNWITKIFMLGSPPVSKEKCQSKTSADSLASNIFRHWYGSLLMEPTIKVIVLLWLIAYLALAVWGCLQLREGLEPKNLLVADSYAISHYAALDKYFFSYGQPVQIVVSNAPDMANSTEREKVINMTRDFANTPHTTGNEGIEFWMDDFIHYFTNEAFFSIDHLDANFHGRLCIFVHLETYRKWSEDITWWPNGTTECEADISTVQSFRFLAAMKNFNSTNKQRDTVELLRGMTENYPEYNLTVYNPMWLFVDQYRTVKPNTLQNIGIAMGCMVVVALLLIPHPLCALWVTLAIASIDVGVVGLMTLWGVNLDAISMVTIIMSIGFSVDFSAHITHGYVVSEEKTGSERAKAALGALGWPILQGALSTVLGVSVLAFVNSYMIVTFFKTVFLVIILGVIHGLVFLPVLLSIFIR